MFNCVIGISSFSLNAGNQQFPAADQINGRFLAMRAHELVIFHGKDFVAAVAADYHRDGVDLQAGARRYGLLTDHLETKPESVWHDSRQRPYLKSNAGNLGKAVTVPFFKHHIEHILSNGEFMHSKSL
jgi:hypothetical protein